MAAHPPGSIEPPRLTVVIVNYNGWDDVARLAGTLAQEPEVASGRCEVIVVDNASEGLIPSVFCPPPRFVRLILRDQNGGFSVGVNAGFAESRSPWLLVLNPDVIAEPGLISRVFARIDHQETRPEGPAAVVGFLLRNEDGSKQPSVGVPIGLFRSLRGQFVSRSRRKYQSGRLTKPGPVSWVTGACMLIDASVLRELGGMDEDFFLYYEEVALCRSVKRLGRRVEFDDTVSVVHLRPLQDRPISPWMRVITRHSKLLYFRKHLPRWQFLTLTWVIALEARLKGRLASKRRDPAEARSWTTIAAMARSMRLGVKIGGINVRTLADATVQDEPNSRLDSVAWNLRPMKPPTQAASKANRQ